MHWLKSKSLQKYEKEVLPVIAGGLFALSVNAQTALKKVYNESIDPIGQIDQALVKAKSEGKFVICQVGGNWCPWCLRFADFITNDSAISKTIESNFEYIHVNYNPRQSNGAGNMEKGKTLMKRLNNAGRFGFPVFVVLDEEGKVIHIQDSSLSRRGERLQPGESAALLQELDSKSREAVMLNCRVHRPMRKPMK